MFFFKIKLKRGHLMIKSAKILAVSKREIKYCNIRIMCS